jgi:hypothetical protein
MIELLPRPFRTRAHPAPLSPLTRVIADRPPPPGHCRPSRRWSNPFTLPVISLSIARRSPVASLYTRTALPRHWTEPRTERRRRLQPPTATSISLCVASWTPSSSLEACLRGENPRPLPGFLAHGAVALDRHARVGRAAPSRCEPPWPPETPPCSPGWVRRSPSSA